MHKIKLLRNTTRMLSALLLICTSGCLINSNSDKNCYIETVHGNWLFMHHYATYPVYNFYIYVPTEFWNNTDETYPLILFLHGDGGDRSFFPDPYPEMLSGGPLKPLYDRLKKEIIDNRKGLNSFVAKSIVVYPKIAQIDPNYSSPLGSWNPTIINNLFDDIVNTYRVNTRKIYITGLSYGGGGTWYYANNNTRTEYNPAAIVPICSGLYEGLQKTGNVTMPVWTFHCFDDPAAPYNSSISTMQLITGQKGIMSTYPFGRNYSASDSDCTISYIQNVGLTGWKKNCYVPEGSYTYTMFRTGGHNAWDQAYANENLYSWLFSQTRE